MFKKGDFVMHPGYGAGLVTGIKSMTMNGNKRRYYYVDLMDGDRSLMIPVEEAEAVGLGPVVDEESILAVLRGEPGELEKDYRARQARMSKKIYSGDLEKVAEALRDLAWRRRSAQVSIQDGILLDKAKRLLASVLASHRPDRDFEKAQARLSRVLLQNFQQQEAASA
jgi:CarD family transcriptional regulator